MQVKAKTTDEFVKFRRVNLVVNADGTVDGVPAFALPELLASGQIEHDDAIAKIDVRAELAKASGAELSFFLNSHGVADHRFDAVTHYHSARLRQMAKDSPQKIVEPDPSDPKAPVKEYELWTDIADHLDSLHRQFHGGHGGRIVVLSDEEKRQMALDLHDGKAMARGGEVVPK